MTNAFRNIERVVLLVMLIALSAGNILADEIRSPKLRVLYWSSGILDSLIYQPWGDGIDAHICHNGNWPTDGIYCDSINYGNSTLLALKEDWHWTRRSFIRFDTLVSSYDSLQACELWLYKIGTATNTNWIQAYLVTEIWEEDIVTWETAPTVNMLVTSDTWTPTTADWEGWFSLDIETIYENWVAGPNGGLQLRQQDLDSDDGQEIISSDYMFCTLSIDSLWVSEETDCDSQNLVRICYEASDFTVDSMFISLGIEHSGMPVATHSIIETVPGYSPPNLGWVTTGTYCFYWDMSTDYFGFEGCDFLVEISAHNQTTEMLTVTDSIAIPDAEGVGWDGDNLWITRSFYDGGVPTDSQRVFHVNPFTHELYGDSCNTDELFDGYTADCVWHDGYLWILGGGLSGQRAKLFKFDVTTCTIVDSSAAIIPPTRWGQGLDYYSGYFYVCDSRGKIYRVDPTPPYSATLWLDLETMHPGLMSGSISADALVFALGSIWILRNPGPADHVLIQFDYAGNVLDSFTLASTTGFGPEGITFDGECFWYTDHTEEFVYRVCLWGCDDTLSGTYCLDAKPPNITAICPEDPIYIGDTVEFNWLNDDMFPSSEPGSLIIENGITRTAFPIDGSSAEIVVPEVCGSTNFVVTQRDSFCNWEDDTCVLDICSRFDVMLVCGPCGGTSSCIDQEVRFTAIDSICEEEIVSLYYTLWIFDSLGDSTSRVCDVYYDVPIPGSSTISIWIPAIGDGDSVSFSLDSLENYHGCITRP